MKPLPARMLTLVPAAVLVCMGAPTQALAQSALVYRCPGPPVLYTDALTAQEAKDRNCRSIEGASVTVVQAPKKPASGLGNAAAGTPPSGAANTPARPGDSKVDPAAQRARDSDARRILSDELKREEDRLAALQREFNAGEPERRGDERNYQRYLDRVSDLKAQILRKETDIAALKREIAKLPAER